MTYPNVKTLLKDLCCVQDNTESACHSLNVLIDSLKHLKCPAKDGERLCRDYAAAVRTARPANTPLMHLLNFFKTDLKACVSQNPGKTVSLAVKRLEEKREQFNRQGKFLAENGLSHVRNGDTIFVLHADKVIEDLLVQAWRELGRRFRVVLLDRCGECACRACETLRSAGLDAVTLPPDSELDSYLNGPAKLFMGGMTVTADRKVLAPKGTADMVDTCRAKGVKVCLFAGSLWYSPQRSTDRDAFRISNCQCDFSLEVTSHDMVCLARIDHIVTEFGEVGVDGRLTVLPVSLKRLKAIDADESSKAAETAVQRAMSAA